MTARGIIDDIAGNCLLSASRRLARIVTSLYEDELRPHHIKGSQLNLLVVIAKAGPVRRSDIGRYAAIDPSPMTVVGAPGYLRQRGKPQRPEQLNEHACINVKLIGGALYRWAFVEETDQITPRSFAIDVKGPLIVNGPTTCLSAAVSGVGLTYNIARIVQPLIKEGLLEAYLEKFMPESPGFFIYFTSRKQMLPKLRAFIDFWQEHS